MSDRFDANVYAKETYDFMKQHGLCVKCCKERAFYKHVMCPACMEKINVRDAKRVETEQMKEDRNNRRKETYQSRKENGLCVRCGKKKATQGTKCLECYVGHKRAQDGWRSKNIKKHYKEHGLCIRCGGKPEDGRTVCHACHERMKGNAEHARSFIKRSEHYYANHKTVSSL